MAAALPSWDAEVVEVADSGVLFGHLTDTHVVGAGLDENLHVDNNGRLAEVVASLEAEDPSVDAVLATGDLTVWGRSGDYAMLADLLAPLTVPVLAIPGNHDDRDRMRTMFPDLPWADASHASWVVDVQGVRVIGLDSTIPGEPGAEFDDRREAWLGEILQEEHHGPTVLTVHHPPFRTGIEWMDRSGFVGVDRLASLLTAHPVDRVLCGHMHRSITSTVGGVPVQVGLPTIEAVELDLRRRSRPRLNLDPYGYGLVWVRSDSIVTHTRFVGPGNRPFAPEWAGLLD